MKRAIASSQGQRSSSVSGTPFFIFSTLAAGWNSSPSRKTKPSFFANKVAIVVLPEPETPMTTRTVGRKVVSVGDGMRGLLVFSATREGSWGSGAEVVSSHGRRCLRIEHGPVILHPNPPQAPRGGEAAHPPPPAAPRQARQPDEALTLHRFPSWVMFVT